MTDLLPILFTRGQNESIDPRVAPNEVHSAANNVRWRKNGRPAKKYGCAAVVTTGLSTRSYDTQPVNVLTSWNNTPVISVGSSVRQLNSALGWNSTSADVSEISHFAPGEHSAIVRDESAGGFGLGTPSSGYSTGMILHAWNTADTVVSVTVQGIDGETIVPPVAFSSATRPRVISTNNFIYILSQSGTTLELSYFNPATLAMGFLFSPGTLDAVGSGYDAIGRGSDLVISYQSAAGTVTTKLYSAVAVPVLQNTQSVAMAVATGSQVAVQSVSGSQIFVAICSTNGTINYAVYNNALSAAVGFLTIEVDANNNGHQPGIVVESSSVASIVWGGFVAATSTSYMRAVRVSSAGLLSTTGTFYGVSLVSKPFLGPAYSTMGAVDGSYVWVATQNANGTGSTKWDSQRAFYLVKFRSDTTAPLRRQMHIPNLAPSEFQRLWLGDVLNLGAGYGFMAPLHAAVRFGNGLIACYGFDTVTARSIFESVAAGVRDSAMAGRVLQLSGGSLFEFGGNAAEETGFSNAPVIQSITGGGGGALTGASNYIYRAVYEWLDNQGRRHRSAPSDPVTFASGANSSATLVMKPLIADAHFPNSSGGATGLGTKIHVYRTLAGQSTYHRVTPNIGAPAGSPIGVATVSYTDLMGDGPASIQEYIYTDGGVLENTLCPPHTFQAVCNGRLWVGGQLEACAITASKILVDGEPTQFSDLESFGAWLPQKCTGLASIDGTIVAFSKDRIYLVTGDGPNDQGIGSFNPPVELPTDVGCVDWRSVLETSVGVFFLSKRGIYLLPRGFNTPVFVGAEVMSTLAQYPYMVSATVVTIPSTPGKLGETTARFVIGSTTPTPNATLTLVYDLATGGWSVDDQSELVLVVGTWSDSFISSRLSGTLQLFAENTLTGYSDRSSRFVSTSITTGDVRPFGVAGYGSFKSVVLVGEFVSTCFVQVNVSVDGVSATTYQFDVSSADYSDNTVYLDVTPKFSMGTSIKIQCIDNGNPNGSSSTEGFVMQALFIETDLIGKTKRLAEARRA